MRAALLVWGCSLTLFTLAVGCDSTTAESEAEGSVSAPMTLVLLRNGGALAPRARGARGGSSAPARRGGSGAFFVPFAQDVGAQARQAFFDAFVAAVDVVDAVHLGFALAHEAR